MEIKVSFVSLLTILFIALKLFNVIAWPWWLVLSPLWISLALYVLSFLFIFGIGILALILKNKK